MQQDARGVPVTGGSKFACDQYEIALRQFQSYVGDPIATIDAALAASPPFVAGHLFRALAMFTMSEKSFLQFGNPLPRCRDGGRLAARRESDLRAGWSMDSARFDFTLTLPHN